MVQQDGVAHSRRRRARERDDEELVWDGEGSLSQPGSQQLPPSVRRDGDEHEAGEASHRGAVSCRQGRSLGGIGKRSENERLRTPKMARDKACTIHLRCGPVEAVKEPHGHKPRSICKRSCRYMFWPTRTTLSPIDRS